MKKVTHIIFDVDGTLYPPNKKFMKILNSYWVKQVAEVLSLPEDKAREKYLREKKRYKSSTITLSKFGLGSCWEVIRKAEHFMRPYYKKSIRKDRRLIRIFKELKKKYTLCTLRNGTKQGTRFILSLLGFSQRSDKRKTGFGPFDYIFPTVETGSTKPDPRPYKNILDKTKLPGNRFVMVGDREDVDLFQAKKFGMQTVLVDWGRNLSYNTSVTDVVIDTIYEMRQLIQ